MLSAGLSRLDAGARVVLVLLGVLFGALAYVFFSPGIARRAMQVTGLARLLVRLGQSDRRVAAQAEVASAQLWVSLKYTVNADRQVSGDSGRVKLTHS